MAHAIVLLQAAEAYIENLKDAEAIEELDNETRAKILDYLRSAQNELRRAQTVASGANDA